MLWTQMLCVLMDVEFSDELKPIGYIPGQRIRMVKHAMDRKEIISARISSVTRHFNPVPQKNIYRCFVSIIKRGKWSSLHNSYVYGCTF